MRGSDCLCFKNWDLLISNPLHHLLERWCVLHLHSPEHLSHNYPQCLRFERSILECLKSQPNILPTHEMGKEWLWYVIAMHFPSSIDQVWSTWYCYWKLSWILTSNVDKPHTFIWSGGGAECWHYIGCRSDLQNWKLWFRITKVCPHCKI